MGSLLANNQFTWRSCFDNRPKATIAVDLVVYGAYESARLQHTVTAVHVVTLSILPVIERHPGRRMIDVIPKRVINL